MALMQGGIFEEEPARAQSWASQLQQEGLSVRGLSAGLSSYQVEHLSVHSTQLIEQLFCGGHMVGE